ncbi:MAG TPA: choice-of-anchor B family protein [Bacteroidia bacterium]|nr:choice-of-anchor B family protein [Bacteroidia bacterium]
MLLTLTITLNAQQNITFRSKLTYPGVQLANIGGYVDASGNEYALVGTSIGLSIVDVTDPVNPDEKFAVPGLNSTWREVKTWQHYAYVTTEAGGGLQIINLQYLPDSVQIKQYTGDGAIAGQLSNIHALHIEDGYVYLFGGGLFSGAAKICDLNPDPWNPVYRGHTPGPYIHDGYIRNDTLWAAHIYAGYFGVYNVVDKTNPVLVATQNTPNNFPHNTWLSGNGRTLFTTDEVNNSYLTSYDVSDVTNIRELDRIQIHPGDNSAIHNTHVLNNYAISSWYTSGISIVDVSKPSHLVQTGYYDTSPNSGAGFSGCWGVYPFLPSGNFVASDMQQGLYVLTPTYVRGCHLTGYVRDSITNFPVNNVLVEILSNPEFDHTKITGAYSTGLATAGTYSIRFSKTGYVTKTVAGISLSNGVFAHLDVKLVPVSTAVNPVADAYVRSGSFANTNYGSSLSLQAKKADSGTDVYREIYLRFNIADMDSNVSNATLRLYGKMNTSFTPSADVTVRDVSNQTWQESLLTFNNRPAASSTVYATRTISGTVLQYYEWNITNLVQQKKTAGDTLISLVLRCKAKTTDNFATFYSKEQTSNKPQLIAFAGVQKIGQSDIAQEATDDQTADPFSVSVSGNKIFLKNIKEKNDFTFTLYDMKGRLILNKKINPTVPDDEIEIPGLTNGLYLFNFKNAYFNYTKKYNFRNY